MQKQTEINAALLRKYPEQVVLVTTRSTNGKANVMAVGWTAIASYDPLMFSLAIDDEAYTYQLINETKEFVVAYPSESMAEITKYVGECHGHQRDKFSETALATLEPSSVKAPLIKDAVANFECTLVDIYKPGDCPIIIGKVIAAHENRDVSIKRLYTIGKNHLLGSVSIS